MISIDTYNFEGKRALVRVDFNVPLDKETMEVTDDKRIRAALPTIQHILRTGGSVILLSHFGRPKEGPEEKFSLKHIIKTIEKNIGKPVKFATDCIGQDAIDQSANLQPGEVLLLENVRFYTEETKGDDAFAKKLAALGDCYVNDAFGAAHRAHASTTQIAQFFPNDKMVGFLMKSELESARKVLNHAERPFTAIVGGAKVSDKVLIVENLLNIADHIIIGGGMSYTFYKAQGGHIGQSLCEDERLETCREILAKAKEKGVHIHLPQDSTIANRFAADAETKVAPSNQIPDGWMGLDIGTEAIAQFRQVLLASKTILWNGPMGVFEMKAFENGTKSVAEAVVEATSNGAFSLIGGGDSAAAVQKFGMSDQVSYVSTGGGALLEYFEGKVLPGVQAIEA
ncbi:MAG: phosphoglycerate kinase [Crocinitomicaceae bacterium]|nr:phosphoglycerate kinase [Crocinitomicaceae bacterium]MBP6033005.1 phosphoglycerate kinase [Crocinitomicaceae bacterium]